MSDITRPTHLMVICTHLLNRPQRVELVQSIPTWIEASFFSPNVSQRL